MKQLSESSEHFYDSYGTYLVTYFFSDKYQKRDYFWKYTNGKSLLHTTITLERKHFQKRNKNERLD